MADVAQPQLNKTEISVLVISPEAVVYEGKATALTSLNEKGKFDVLPMHINFISIVNKTLVVHEVSGTKKEIPIEKGVVKVFENTVYVFLGIEEFEKEAIQAPASPTPPQHP